VLSEFGLGYLQLGCSTTTLSGGEAQRLNLASELLKQRRSGTLFIFDEPTRGLHPADIRHLLALFDRLISTGNTVVAIEHDLRVLAISDWLIDLGPGAGAAGGRVLHCGPPEALADNQASITGRYLHGPREGADSPVRKADLSAVEPGPVGPVGAGLADAALPLKDIAQLLSRAVAVVAGARQEPGQDQPTPYGLALGSLTLVSAELALMGFVVKSRSSSWSAIVAGRRFCVNLLSADQRSLSTTFSRTRPDLRFTALAWEPSARGGLRLAGTYAVIECHLEGTYRMGDHDLVLAKCLSVAINPEAGCAPLLRADEDGTAHGEYGWRMSDSGIAEVTGS
jgi:excinuclease ABC subunit A